METDNAWVSIKDMNQREILCTAEQITDAGVANSNVKLQPLGTILLSFKLTIGRVALAGRPLYTNEAIAGLRPRKILPEYLYHGLQQWNLLQDVDQAIKGATLNKAKLERIEFTLPESKVEQEMIAGILSLIERGIEQTEALVAKQHRVNAGLTHDLLSRGTDSGGVLRSEDTHEFKDSPLGRIPAEWAVRTLEDMTPRNAPIGYGIVQPGDFDHSGVPVAGIYTINTNFEQWHKSSRRIESAYSRSRIQPGDVLLSIKGTTGRVGVVPAGMAGNISREVARIRPLDSINPKYLRYLMLSDFFQRYLANAEVGTTRAELSIKNLRQLVAVVPQRDEQDEIVSRLASLERDWSKAQEQLAKYRAIRTALMQDLLTGRKRVTPLLDEVAEPASQQRA